MNPFETLKFGLQCYSIIIPNHHFHLELLLLLLFPGHKDNNQVRRKSELGTLLISRLKITPVLFSSSLQSGPRMMSDIKFIFSGTPRVLETDPTLWSVLRPYV